MEHSRSRSILYRSCRQSSRVQARHTEKSVPVGHVVVLFNKSHSFGMILFLPNLAVSESVSRRVSASPFPILCGPRFRSGPSSFDPGKKNERQRGREGDRVRSIPCCVVATCRVKPGGSVYTMVMTPPPPPFLSNVQREESKESKK